jgi:PAS domain S-box-containing protein
MNDSENLLGQASVLQDGGVLAMAAVDAQGAITAWTAGATRLLGYRPEEILGRYGADLLIGDLPRAAVRGIERRRDWSGRVTLRHHDSHPVEVDVHAVPVSSAQENPSWAVAAVGPAAPHDHADEFKQWAYDQMPLQLGCFDENSRLIVHNEAGVHGLAKAEEQMRGRRLSEIYASPEDWRVEQAMEQVLATGEQMSVEIFGQGPGEDHPHPSTILAYPLKDPDGRVRGVSLAAMDTTEQYMARQRLAMVNAASSRIGTTLDTARTAQELADLATGRFADFVSVDLLIPGRENTAVVRRTAQQSVLAGCPESVAETGKSRRYPEGSPMAGALAAGEPVLCQATDASVRRWLAGDHASSRLAAQYGMHSFIVAPLLARGAILGLVQYARHRNPAPFDPDDLLLAQEITAKAALSIDNAQRYTRERDTALALQRSLLPQDAFRHSALDVASRYVPACSRAGVGGDWFDVIPLSGSRVALVVGDVVGHGMHASVTMGLLRTAVRTLADVDLPPDELLTYLDDLVLLRERKDSPPPQAAQDQPPQAAEDQLPHPGEITATCLYAVYDPVARHCTLARAGHPAPAIRHPDGTVTFPDLPAGPPLGLGSLPFESAELEMPDGTTIALFTDGLIKSASLDIDEGTARLSRALRDPAAPPEQLCDDVLASLPPGPLPDDIALLIARTRGLGASQVATWDLPCQPSEVAHARQMTADKLTQWELEDASFVTELIVSELVTNAIRYGAPPIQLRLINDTSLICEVSDACSTAPHLRHARVFDEGGRGLLLVAQFAKRWGTRHTPYGKTIWAEQEELLPGL